MLRPHHRTESRTNASAWRFAVCAAAVVACGVACGSEDAGAGTGGALAGAGGMAGGTEDPGFAASVQPLFIIACNCHQSTPLKAPFSLKAAEAYSNLVGVASSQLPTMNLVEPGNLDESYLWHKLEGTQVDVGGMGNQMPSTIPLKEDEKAIVERWIDAGAPP